MNKYAIYLGKRKFWEANRPTFKPVELLNNTMAVKRLCEAKKLHKQAKICLMQSLKPIRFCNQLIQDEYEKAISDSNNRYGDVDSSRRSDNNHALMYLGGGGSSAARLLP